MHSAPAGPCQPGNHRTLSAGRRRCGPLHVQSLGFPGTGSDFDSAMKTSRPEVADVAAFGRWWVGACVLNPLNCVYAAGSLGSCAGAGGAIQSACARGRPATNRSRADGVRPRPGAKHTLFQILHVLRRLDEPLAETLIASHKQLAAAARRFPHGMESVMQEAEARRVETCGVGSGYVMGGSRGDFPYLRALMQDRKSVV